MKTINNDLIRSFKPCYDPSEIGIPDDETLTVTEWVAKYRDKVQSKADVVWLLCRNEFMSDRDLRLFAVWCARQCNQTDPRSIEAINVAKRYANGEATDKELAAARAAAEAAAWAAAWAAARDAAWAAARGAAWAAARTAAEAAARGAAEAAARGAAEAAAWTAAEAAAWDAAEAAACDNQINQLLTYFND